jgi:hypothetical protein
MKMVKSKYTGRLVPRAGTHVVLPRNEWRLITATGGVLDDLCASEEYYLAQVRNKITFVKGSIVGPEQFKKQGTKCSILYADIDSPRSA